MLAIGAGLGTSLIALNALFGQKPDPKNLKKYDVYECGVPPEGSAAQQFSVRYYLIGIVFLLFDVEVVFLYPWAVVYRRFLSSGTFILFEMALFLALLLVGYIYLIRKGGLEWD